jgi:UDP-N-acetylglucosamine transferase subunit ALG13
VTVGTHPQQFDRLLKEVEVLAEKNKSWIVFAQTGNSRIQPKNFDFKKFLSPKEMEQRIKQSNVIISHACAGSIIGALEEKKPLIVVPRLQAFSEHTNDHQKDLAVAMQDAGKLIAVLEIKDLEKAIKRSEKFRPTESTGSAGIIMEIEEFLVKQ